MTRRNLPTASRKDQLEAQARLREYAKLKGGKSEALSRSVIASLGRENWPHTYAKATSDEDAVDNWTRYIELLRFFNPEEYFVKTQQLLLMDASIVTMGSARWFAEGLPVYRLGHKRAAAFMATTVPVEMAEHVKPPRRAFYVELPDGLIELKSLTGELTAAVGVLVQVVTTTQERETHSGERIPPGDYWRWICTTRSPTTLWEMNRRVEDLIGGTVLTDDEYYGIGMEMDAHDHRVRGLIKRLVISMCLDLNSGKELRHKTEPWSRAGKKAEKGPNFNVYMDPSEVKFDARPYIKAFLSGDRKSPDFQHTVTGHWKSQAHGPRLSLRKPLWIYPYPRYEHLPEQPSA